MDRLLREKGWRYVAATVAVMALCGAMAWAADTPGAVGDRTVVRAAAERGVAGITPEQYFDRQQKLHARLTATMPAGVQKAGVRVQLTPEEHASIEKRIGSGPGPLRIGVTKSVTPAAGLARGTGRTADDGSFVWATTITSEGAGGIRVHLENMNLPDGAELYFFNSEGEAYGPYTRSGPNGDGDFWTPSVFSETGVLMLTARQEIRGAPFVVTEVGHIGRDFPRAVEQLGEGLCDNALCIIDATCFNVSAVADAKDAVAKMEWVKTPWLYTCTGGLIADTDPGTQIPYFLTANHCLSSDNSTIEFFWFYRTQNCGDACPDDSNFPKTIGATVKATNSVGDFTLMELSQTPPSGAVYLGWNNTDIAYDHGLDLYRISHPNFGAQVFSHHQVDVDEPECTEWPRGERIYSKDIEGATDGGSSGSPVVDSAGDVRGQLSGCCGYNCGDVCDAASNWTVDGALAYYWAQVEPYLDPGGCTTDEECDDGLFCTGVETCVSGSCQSSGDPCTGDDVCNETTDTCDPPVCNNNGTCESGEDCNNCPNDCISGSGGAVCGNGLCEAGDGEDCQNCSADCNGITTGAPSGRFCCGATEGCGDSRCNEGSYSCTTEPQGSSYCCGDGVCEGAEDSNNCAIDCGGGCTSNADCASGEICCDGACVVPVCSVDGDCADGEACTTDTCYNADTCSAYCDNTWPACGISDGCCGPTCDSSNDPDCDSCVEAGGYCTSDADCCSNSCHPVKNYCR